MLCVIWNGLFISINTQNNAQHLLKEIMILPRMTQQDTSTCTGLAICAATVKSYYYF